MFIMCDIADPRLMGQVTDTPQQPTAYQQHSQHNQPILPPKG